MAHTFVNLSFETAGPNAGEAFGWNIEILSSLERFAPYDVQPSVPFDSFETGWFGAGFLFLLTPTDIEEAAYGAGVVETFEVDWDNNAFLFLLGSTETSQYENRASIASGFQEPYVLSDGQTLLVAVDGGGAATATFNTADFVDIGQATAAEVAAVVSTDIAGATAEGRESVLITSDTISTGSEIEVTGGSAASAFDFPTGSVTLSVENEEDYEEFWRNNENTFTFTMGTTDDAMYDPGGLEAVEDFEEQWSNQFPNEFNATFPAFQGSLTFTATDTIDNNGTANWTTLGYSDQDPLIVIRYASSNGGSHIIAAGGVTASVITTSGGGINNEPTSPAATMIEGGGALAAGWDGGMTQESFEGIWTEALDAF